MLETWHLLRSSIYKFPLVIPTRCWPWLRDEDQIVWSPKFSCVSSFGDYSGQIGIGTHTDNRFPLIFRYTSILFLCMALNISQIILTYCISKNPIHTHLPSQVHVKNTQPAAASVNTLRPSSAASTIASRPHHSCPGEIMCRLAISTLAACKCN